MPPLSICLVSSEVAPFAKTGGLADVSAALARYLAKEGHDVRVVLPLYRRVRDSGIELRPVEAVTDVEITFGERAYTFSLSAATLEKSELDVYFVDCPDLYARDGLYTGDEDEPLRFALLTRAAIEAAQRWQWAPDVFHVNDWHTGLLPLYLKTLYAWDELFRDTKTVLTIHNIGYQGVFSTDVLPALGLEESRGLLHRADVEEGHFGFLKTGILYADALTTVSETYAREIQTEELGMGLEELLATRDDHLFGIVNGVDYAEWDPETDTKIPHPYTRWDLAGKARNKSALLDRMGLPETPRAPVLGIISRLTAQKGFELLPDILPVFLQKEDMRLCVLGSGEEKYEQYFSWLADRFPDKVAFHNGYDDPLAHLIEAGADLFLMPSRYEPCGLNQMYSLRYGTAPVVRRTGGLADTVEPFDPETGIGTGFVFDDFTPDALFQSLSFALEAYRDPHTWGRLVSNAMAKDFSWNRQGEHYVRLYERLSRT